MALYYKYIAPVIRDYGLQQMVGQNPLQRLQQDINEVEGQIKQAESNAETATSEKD